MDRETVLLVTLGLLVLAAAIVAAVGWILFARERRSDRADRLNAADRGDTGAA